jgi:hypothetical protein
MIGWIDRRQRVPDDRRIVLVCCNVFVGPYLLRRRIEVTRCNVSRGGGGVFDVERGGGWVSVWTVTHWAEIDMPPAPAVAPPPRDPPQPLPPTPRPASADGGLDAIDGTG